jgi:hypothetical protein
MDMQTLKMNVFLKSLTEEQADACERDEKQLTEIFIDGWSEENAILFHRAMLLARRLMPDVTVSGVFEGAFRLGLSFLGDEELCARLKEERAGDVIVYGVQRQNGKSAGGSVLMDGATVVRIKPKRVWQKGQVRGV